MRERAILHGVSCKVCPTSGAKTSSSPGTTTACSVVVVVLVVVLTVVVVGVVVVVVVVVGNSTMTWNFLAALYPLPLLPP